MACPSLVAGAYSHDSRCRLSALAADPPAPWMWTSRTLPRASTWKSADMSGSEAAPDLAAGGATAQPTSCAGTSFAGFASGRGSPAQQKRTMDAARANRRMPRRFYPQAGASPRKRKARPRSGSAPPFAHCSSRDALRRLFEVGQVPAEEVARALLHLPDALAREAPLLAEVLQRPRIVLRQAVAQDVPRQLAHPLAHPPQGVAHVLLPLGADDLLVRRRAVVAQAVEVCRLALWIEGLLQRDVPRRQAAVGHGAAHRTGPVLQAARDVRADPPHCVGREAVALLGVEVLDGLEEPVVPFLHQVFQADAATHELAGHRDDQAQVVDHQLLLRALVALAGATSDLELRLPIERGMGPDQLDQRRKVIELAAVAHFSPFLPFPLCCLQRPSPPNDPTPGRPPSRHSLTERLTERLFDAQRPVLLLISFRGVMTHRSLADAGQLKRNSAKTLRTSLPNEFRPPVRGWFEASFASPTRAQVLGWPPILSGRSTLLLAPTGSGKTLAAFLTAIDQLMFTPPPQKDARCRILYVSPLKALAVDVEKNLRAPLAGIAAQAERTGASFHFPQLSIRTGDTPASERARMGRAPPDILITTPESLYLLLTSQAREILRSVETVIVDEIHALVTGKRGAHLFLSLERLEGLRGQKPSQRIGLSATQRPLDEVARLLGGGEPSGKKWRARPVEVVDAGSRKQFDLRVEVPVEDMRQIGELEERPSGAVGPGQRRSIWPSIHPRLVELIRGHRSTMIFVNSRRLAERLAGALNELAGSEIALAHHGSVAREKRAEIEDRLKKGELPCIVATSSLELGIDMGSVDLVVQIEAPPSIASGLQRIGRAGHQVGGVPRGIVFPKHRGDLLGSAAAAEGMAAGQVEETFYPRNPLDVLAQQIVATCAERPWKVDELYALVRRSAPFAELPRPSFEGVLDMLSGRYPSDEFAELKARLSWDRVAGIVRIREGAARVAVVNGGTIPDRGLYGVFLLGQSEGKTSRRVGELDEEMVFETHTGEVFVLGASSWRVEEITHDKVLVSPAPGEPGKMPFWHGDRPGRPLEFGQVVGRLARELSTAPPAEAEARLKEQHGLDERAARNLLQYLQEQVQATGEVPSDRAVIVERYLDEAGDFRVCVLTPFGARVHAPWATAVVARLQADRDAEVEMMYSDDGMVFRLPESEEPPEPALFFPSPDEIEDLVARSLGETSLFAARFRENAARALLLPRRHPGRRSPLWAQRKRAADLLSVAKRYGSFPILLETYRECLRDVFDLPGLTELLRRVRDRRVRVVTADTRTPSPFASSLLFAYVANFIYDGDAPLAERRAQALSVDQAQLRELQRLDARYPAKHADAAHDLLLGLGDLTAG